MKANWVQTNEDHFLNIGFGNIVSIMFLTEARVEIRYKNGDVVRYDVNAYFKPEMVRQVNRCLWENK